MAKLTKQETKNHNKILDLIHSDKPMSYEEKIFVLENFHEGANTNNSALGAFFTPIGLARDFCIDASVSGSVIDLCAGIGSLSFAMINHYYYHKPKSVVCVEINHSYYEIGKRIVPEADWIHDDALTVEFDKLFDCCISNPPFGKIKTSDWQGKYNGAEFEYKIIEKASMISHYGCFIIPQMSAPFRYSNTRCGFKRETTSKCQKFIDQTGIIMDAGCGVDTHVYINDWNGVSPVCEIVCCEFEHEEQHEDVNKMEFTFKIE
ncbi:hypothetical protein POP12_190 [Pectobacterium phage POP12]|nr:hypothetical protein POP12_190 [Pectobacterium phage POP12]